MKSLTGAEGLASTRPATTPSLKGTLVVRGEMVADDTVIGASEMVAVPAPVAVLRDSWVSVTVTPVV